MIINFRYHIFTITAIFAALGIGILIGSSIIGNEGLLEEQQRIVREISNDIDRMKDENTRLLKSISSLEANLDYKKKIEEQLYPLLLEDKMEGRRFFLLYNNVSEEKLNELVYYLKLMNINFDFIQFDKDKWSEIFPELNNFNYLISWNLGEEIYTGMDLEEKEDFSLLNYQGDDVENLLINIVKEVLNAQ